MSSAAHLPGRLRALLKPPHTADPDEQPIARIVQFGLRGGIVVSIFSMCSTLLVDSQHKVVIAGWCAAICGLCVAARVALDRVSLRRGILPFLVATFATVILMLAFRGGVQSPVASSLLPMVVFAGLVFGKRGAYVSAAGAFLGLSSLFVLGALELLPPVGPEVTHPLRYVLLLSGNLVLTMLLLEQAADLAQERLTSLRQHREALLGANRELVVAHESLEAEVERRTHELVETNHRLQEEIEARTRWESELERARLAAEAAADAKALFLANMSHELRTPMNAVVGMSGLLLDTRLDDEQRDCVETIRTSSDALLEIIDDILDFSKFESGLTELESQPFDVHRCVEDALELVASRAYAKDLELGYALAPDVPRSVLGDITRTRQVLTNLLSNAVKFTETGSVQVEVSVQASRPDGVELCFAVRDTGIGIPPERIERLFTAFTQADASTTRKYGGTGLGLAISRKLCSMMGGSLSVDSVVAEGSVFRARIVVPLAEPASAPAGPSLRVLVIARPGAERSSLLGHLTALGHQAHVAEDRTSTVLRLGLAPCDVVILGEGFDPGSLGLSTAGSPRLMRLSVRGQRPPPGLGLEALPTIARPARRSQVEALLTRSQGPSTAESFARPGDPAAPPAEPAASARPPLRVLVAEDNLVNQKVARQLLLKLGYSADVVANGLEVLGALEHERYDLIFMDVQMPEMDGLEATRRIRALSSSFRQPTIVAMTANAISDDREACLAAGMDHYLSKPVRADELRATLERYQRALTP
jgi:signal transduction histidine kinase/CheY-like chemotaxis protein